MACCYKKKRSAALLLLLRGGSNPVNGIADGVEAKDKQEWFVLLTRKKIMANDFLSCSQGKRIQCGGTLIAQDMVLTAAHCFDHLLKPDGVLENAPDTAWVGAKAVTQNIGDVGRAFNVDSVIVMEQYDPKDEFNLHDLAIVKLKEQDPSSPNRGALAENTVFATYGETDMTQHQFKLHLFGFGMSTSQHRPTASVLKTAKTIYEFEDDDCYVLGSGFNSEFQICTYPFVTCYGDSGGGLVRWDNAQKAYDVVGIASFMDNELFAGSTYCTAAHGEPLRQSDVYTKVDAYKATIDAIVCEHSLHPPGSCGTVNTDGENIMNFVKHTVGELPTSTAQTWAERFFWGDWFN